MYTKIPVNTHNNKMEDIAPKISESKIMAFMY
jgi:hypothetical protein